MVRQQQLGDNVAAKDGTLRSLPDLFGVGDSDKDDAITSSTTTSKEMDSKEIKNLKESTENHGKLIEAAARIEVQERRETANKDWQAKVHSKACAAILCLGSEVQDLTVKKAVTLLVT